MVVPKIGAQYVAKKIYDQVMAPPARPAGPVEEEAPLEATGGDLDGQTITDEDDRPIGTAYWLPEVSVYVVAGSRTGSAEELARCVGEPESRLFVRTDESGRIVSLIYAPDPSRMPARVQGLRSDEV